MNKDDIIKITAMLTARAVAHYWETRAAQRRRQEESGRADQGSRSAVTGGAQMDGFIDLFTELFCRKLVLERHYTAAAFITSSPADGINGGFGTPAKDLSVERFAKVLAAHLTAFV